MTQLSTTAAGKVIPGTHITTGVSGIISRLAPVPAIVLAAFVTVVSILYFFNYSTLSWHQDEVMFAALAEQRTSLPTAQLIRTAIADTGEYYAPFITIPFTMIFGWFGNDSALMKLFVSLLILGNGVLLLLLLSTSGIPKYIAVVASIIYLTAPVLLEAYTWTVSMQHLITSALCLTLAASLVRARRAYDQGKPVLFWMLIGSAAALLLGYGREVALLGCAAAVVISLVLRSWRLGLLILGPVLLMLPPQIHAFLGWLNGHQVMRLATYIGWQYGGSFDAAIRNAKPMLWPVYAVSFVIQTTVLLMPRKTSFPSRDPRWLRYAACACLAVLYLRGLGVLPIVLASMLPLQIAEFRLAAGWVLVSVPYVLSLPFAGLIVFAVAATQTPWAVAVVVVLFEGMASLYLTANMDFFTSNFPGVSSPWVFSRYAIYALPVGLILISFISSRLMFAWRRNTLAACIVLAFGNVVTVGQLARTRAAEIPSPFYPALLRDTAACERAQLFWTRLRSNYRAVGATRITHGLITGDATVQRYLATHPQADGRWQACGWWRNDSG